MSLLCHHSQHWCIMGLGLYYHFCSRSSWNIALLIPTSLPSPMLDSRDSGLGASSLALPKTLSVVLALILLCRDPTLLTSAINISEDLLISGDEF